MNVLNESIECVQETAIRKHAIQLEFIAVSLQDSIR